MVEKTKDSRSFRRYDSDCSFAKVFGPIHIPANQSLPGNSGDQSFSYMFLMESDEYSIVGASPEVHVRLTKDGVLIRPIAGTRPRGKSVEEDELLEKRFTSR